MSKQKEIGLFVFRRDLRIEDNVGLYAACAECDKVYCVFVLDPSQIEQKNNAYFSANAFAFMLESILELQKYIGLTVLNGNPTKEIASFAKEKQVTIIYWNLDYTPFSIKRDKAMIEKLEKEQILVKTFDDIPLNAPTKIKPYKVFTPYYNVANEIKINRAVNPDVENITRKDPISENVATYLEKIEKHKNISPERQHGGRKNGLNRLSIAAKFANEYMNIRDDLTQETSRLSPYLKFGVIGKREAYRAVKNADFRRELYWGDFYLQISYHFPHVLSGDISDEKTIPEKNGTYNIDKNFKQQKLKWNYDPKLWEAFEEGKTGIPLVDAAIYQLKTTGYMHNRCRMVVANVLTKFFHIDWRHGEKFFAKWLTDYDPSNNNGGWQWAAGTGADAQPYYRIFNPYTQAKKSDPQCIYIKKWLPHLKEKTPQEIFKMISPIFDYEKERIEAINRFRNAI